MRIEMDESDAAPAMRSRHAGGVGPGDRVVAAEYQRNRSCARDALDDDLEVRAGLRRITREHLDIARIDNAGHMLQHDQPEQLATLLESFLQT